MKICDIFSHNQALQILKDKASILLEIETVLNDETLNFVDHRSPEIKARISAGFNRRVWADRVRVGNSKLTVSFVKAKVGMCVQLGNVARTYADILKLSQLGHMQVIEVGIIVVPDKVESKMLGANYAQYERLAKEIELFESIIHVPMLIIGISD